MDLKTNLIRTYYPSIPARINMGTDFNPIKIEEGDIKFEEGQIKELNEDGIEKLNKYIIEALIEQFLTLPLPSTNREDSENKSYNSAWMQKDLEHLNRKLSAVRKTITAWDTYKITEVVVKKELLAGKIQGLPLNSSLVVNTSEPVYLNGKTYQLGDIVFKDINGNLHQIKSSPSGFFYPSNIQLLNNTNTIQIDYSFFAGSQPPSPTQTIEGNAITQPGHTITKNLALQADNNFYNTTVILTSPQDEEEPQHTLPALKDTDEKPILPKVFAYLYDITTETALEEIYIDNFVQIGDQIVIKNPTTLPIKYIMR